MIGQIACTARDIIDRQRVCQAWSYDKANELGYPICAIARLSTARVKSRPGSTAGHLLRLARLKSAVPCKGNFRSIVRKGGVRSTRGNDKIRARAEIDVDEIPAVFGLRSLVAAGRGHDRIESMPRAIGRAELRLLNTDGN